MRRWIYLLFVLLLAACTSVKQRSCNEISAATLRSVLLKETTIEQLLAWIAQEYHVLPQNVRGDIDQRRAFQILVWDANDVSYTIHMRGSVPTGAIIRYNSRPPSASQVINCLGAPERYSASYKRDVEATKFELELLFPKLNTRASGWKFFYGQFRYTRLQPPAIDGAFPIYRLSVGELISVEEMLGQAPHPDQAEGESRQFKPWPGKWEDIVVEIDPNTHW